MPSLFGLAPLHRLYRPEPVKWPKVGQNGSKIEKKSCHAIPEEIPHILRVSSIFFVFGDFRSNFSVFFPSFWRRAPIGPIAGARANRYFRHNSGSTAQNLDFFGSSVAESLCATFGSPENLAETASTGPQIRFFGSLARFAIPQKNTSARTPKKPKNAKKSKFRQNGAVSSKIFVEDPMTNMLRLTGEQKIRFWIDGPAIWPG